MSDAVSADATSASRGLAWDSEEVRTFRKALPPNQKLVPLAELNSMARANLKQCLSDAGWDTATMDTPAPPDVALADMQKIVRELRYLPPLCSPSDAPRLREELLTRAPARRLMCCGRDSSGMVTM